MKPRAKILVSRNGSREYFTSTIAPSTRARIEALHKATGLARGRLVDLAIGTIEPCEGCRGKGVVSSFAGPDSAVCDACRGSRIVPST